MTETQDEVLARWHRLDADGTAHAYGVMTQNARWAQGLERMPDYMQPGIARWVLFGLVPGSFLQHVIKNDLFAAAGHADDLNQGLLWDYCNFFWNSAPSECWGYELALSDWKGMFPREYKPEGV